MRIQVYKCRFTGALFEQNQRQKYIKHLKKLREEMREQREYARLRDNFKIWFANEKKKITNVDMIVPWIYENQKTLMKAFNAVNSGSWDKWSTRSDELTNFSLSVRYNRHVSNSHVRPHNGVTNWCGQNKDLPTGYPGFAGQIKGSTKRTTKNMSSYPSSDLLNFIDLRTGSGGGGNENWNYEVKIFLADWPGLREQVREAESDEIVNILSGKPR